MNAHTFKKITGISREILDAAIRYEQKIFQENILPDQLVLNPDVIIEKAKESYTRMVLEEVSAEIPSVILPLIRGFNGERKTPEVFHLGYNVLFNMAELVDDLIEKRILINVSKLRRNK